MLSSTGGRTDYPLKSGSNTTLLKAKTEALHSSFFLAIIKIWNILLRNIREAGSLELFKENITPEIPVIPKYIYNGNRKPQILQARMRLGCSGLNEYLHRINLVGSPLCRWGHGIEDAEHFLIECVFYDHIRHDMQTDL